MSEVIAWVLGVLGAILSAFGLYKWRRSAKQAEAANDQLTDAHARNWQLMKLTLDERRKRRALETEQAEAQRRKEILNAVRDNPPGSVVKRWNDGRREGAAGDGRQPDKNGAVESTGAADLADRPAGPGTPPARRPAKP